MVKTGKNDPKLQCFNRIEFNKAEQGFIPGWAQKRGYTDLCTTLCILTDKKDKINWGS